MATTVTKIIDPDNGSGTDYTSLSAWEAAQQGDLTGVRDEIAVATCRCTGGTADTTTVDIDGWTTSATQYIKVWTDTSESYRHAGKWSDTAYRISCATRCLTIREGYARIDGIQLNLTGTTGDDNSAIGFSSDGNNFQITNCIIKKGGSSHICQGIRFDQSKTGLVANTIIYDFRSGTSSWYAGITTGTDQSSALKLYNLTIHNCRTGVSAPNAVVINVLTQACDDGFGGSFDASSNYNLSDIASDAPGANSRNGSTDGQVTFADEANDDFHLALNDTGAKGYGLNLYNDATYPFQTDIDGDDRGGSGASWDIGADEYVAAGATMPPLMYHYMHH